MRLRHIKGAEEEIEKSPYVIHDPRAHAGSWSQVFGNGNPVEIEIGMGKGRFIMELASRNPEINYVGVERYSSVLLRGLEKRAEIELDNICFMCVDARELPEIFAEEEVSRIYLNFSDPWPKDRHAKRRLTSPVFLSVYERILKPEGRIEFKTDNRELFDYSMESIPGAGWRIGEYTYDLHHSGMAEDNVMTEYEMKFTKEGHPICKLTAYRPQMFA